jgi:DivIVA domain-containing protein
MGVDQTSLDRIRNATFPSSRRGYDKREVEKFLARLADWLETGGGDESRSDTVKRELERVGQRTGAILAQAEESAEQIRGEAQDQAKAAVAEAKADAKETTAEADAYSKDTRAEADAYAKETRELADGDAERTRTEAAEDAREAVEQAQAQARRIVEEGTQRRKDIESVIADLVGRRDAVLGDIETLSGKLDTAVVEHRPAAGDDPFDEPDEYDPLAAEEPEDEGEPEPEPAVAEDADEAEEKPPPEKPSPAKKPKRRRTRRSVKA